MPDTLEPITGANPERLIRRPEVLCMTGLSTSSLYRMMNSGTFPRPRRIGTGPTGAVAWRLRDVQRWMDELPVADPADLRQR